MFKRYRFFVALMVCLCVFSCGVIGTACAEATTFTKNTDCSETFFAALKAALTNPGDNENEVTIDVTNITGLTFKDGKITATVNDGATSPFKNDTTVTLADIDDLTGIEKFTALTALDVSGCTALTALDASKLTKLTSINITGVPGIISTYQYEIGERKFLYPVKYEDSASTLTKPTIISDPKFYAKQLVLTEGGLKMYFFMAPGSKEFTADDKMEFTVGGGSTVEVGYNADVYLAYYITKSTGKYDDSQGPTFNTENTELTSTHTAVKHYGFACDVTSIEMADEIIATFLPNGGEAQSETTYTVKAYLNALIEQNKAKTLAEAIKDYGHYVQKPLATLHDWTYTGDNPTHVAMEKARESDYTTDEINTVKSAVTTNYVITVSDNTTKVGCALQLDSRITLIVYIPGTVTVAAENAITPAVTYSVDDKDYATSGYTVVAIPNLNAKELDTEYTITFDTSKTVKVYGLSYVYSVLNLTEEQKNALKDSSTSLTDSNIAQFVTDLQNAVVALYKYHIAEKAYPSN